jgi:hypothetical protein
LDLQRRLCADSLGVFGGCHAAGLGRLEFTKQTLTMVLESDDIGLDTAAPYFIRLEAFENFPL